MQDYDKKYEDDGIDYYTDKIDFLLKQCEELKIIDVVLDNLELCKKEYRNPANWDIHCPICNKNISAGGSDEYWKQISEEHYKNHI